MNKTSKGQIIQIIDEKTVIINLGSDVLNLGDRVNIYSTTSTIFDLDGKSLGSMICEKGVLNVIQVCDNFSFCQKLEIEPSLITMMAPLVRPTSEKPVNLNINKSDITPLENFSRQISVGDYVDVLD